MKKIAIIGASYLQLPLIQKAKDRQIETHVFAWECGDVGESVADHFYPISIVEKDEILAKCEEIGIDGICSIASDLASITVNHVAEQMGLTGNPMASVKKTTNKYLMRQCFMQNEDPSPRSVHVNNIEDLAGISLHYPVIVKPLDRSGSRGITRLESADGLAEAIGHAKEQGFHKSALVEEYVFGKEYSVEYISWEGTHTFLALTKKYTTGAPSYIETAHLQPAPVSGEKLAKIQRIVDHALTSLGVRYGASHSEIKIDDNGEIKIIEIGARMGGDLIGSSLVELSTGYDFVNAVIDVALGMKPKTFSCRQRKSAAVRFLFTKEDEACLENIRNKYSDLLVENGGKSVTEKTVTDSSNRFGYFVIASDSEEDLLPFLPGDPE